MQSIGRQGIGRQSMEQQGVDTMKKTPFVIFVILLSSPLVSASPVFAGGGGGHVGTISDLLWPWVNFSLYVVLMGALLRKPFAKAWQARREGIEQAVTAGAKEMQEAERVLMLARSREQMIEADCKNLNASILEDAKREGAQLLEDAKRRAEFLARQAAEAVNAEQRQAERSLRREVAEKVLARANELLKRELTPEIDRELRRGVLAGVRHLNQ